MTLNVPLERQVTPLEEMAHIIRAARDGKIIEYYNGADWFETTSHNFNFGLRQYRVRP